MTNWKASQFGVSSKGISNITGTDFKRSANSSDPSATSTKGAVSGMANSLSTQTGQTSMGDSRATKS